METLILFSIAAICITAAAITFIICFYKYQMSVGFTFKHQIIKDIQNLSEFMDAAKRTFYERENDLHDVKERITEMQNKIKELTGEPNF